MNMNPKRRLELLLCGALAGCSTYEALPLTPAMPAPSTLVDLRVDAASLPFPALAAHRFDPSDGLDIVETAMLAVANNPDLKLARDDAAIAHAQAYAAGLLPDPQLALSRDLSDSGGADTRAAYSYGLSYDINALLLHSSQRDAAQADAHKTDLNLLWQEWQVVSQARLLFVRVTQSRHLMDTLIETRSLFEDRVRRTQTALERGLLTSDSVSPNIAALQDVQRQIFELERQSAQSARELNALLGLAPSTVLQLQDSAEPVASDGAQVDAALAALPQRRPDLIALQAGYRAQDERYRGALLAQFPALNIGLTRARDSSGIGSDAIGITMSLPFLNRSRGNIAIERATRQKLHDEYQQRLQTSRNDIAGIAAEQALDARQLAQVDAAIVELRTVLARSDTAYRADAVDALTYANARAALLAKQVERINLWQAMLEQRVALQTLLGVDTTAPLSESETAR